MRNILDMTMTDAGAQSRPAGSAMATKTTKKTP